MLKDISYKEYNRASDIHGSVLYPAVMVAPVQKDILLDLSQQGEIDSVFDPFHGSGTALYESHIVLPNATIYGCDINPLANLITKVKLSGVSDQIESHISQLRTRLLNNKSCEIFEFPNREKWYRDDIAVSLTKIRNSIMEEQNKQDRLFFWAMMSDVVRRYSNTRSSTYKLHIKPKEKIVAMMDSSIDFFLSSIDSYYLKYKDVHCKRYTLYKKNLFDCLPEFNNNEIDLLISSPPYGDNDTTVPYGLFSSLALRWIDPNDLELEGWEIKTYSAIDRRSLGNNGTKKELNKFQNELISFYINRISKQKQDKVLHFFYDYFRCLDSFADITKKYIVLTLGNRTVDRVKIDLADITGKYLNSLGYIEYQTMSRVIMNKRMPPLTSSVDSKPVESMKEEYVLIYQK